MNSIYKYMNICIYIFLLPLNNKVLHIYGMSGFQFTVLWDS